MIRETNAGAPEQSPQDACVSQESASAAVGTAVAGRFSWKEEVADNLRLALGIRGVLPYRLHAADQLHAQGHTPWKLWRSSGTDSYFELSCPALRPGCYAVILRLRGYRRTHGFARLYFDVGEGFNEKHTAAIPVRNGHTSLRIMCLPEGARAVRLYPRESCREFRIRAFVILRVSQSYATDRMLRTLGRHHVLFKGQTSPVIWDSLLSRCTDAGEALRELELRYRKVYEQQDPFARYGEWIETREAGWRAQLAARCAGLASRADAPRFSVLVPTYETGADLLRECVESVFRQSYSQWELCIADDATQDHETTAYLRELDRSGHPVRIAWRRQRGHISHATNSALALATGDHIVLLDHDDTLAPDALLAVADALIRKPGARLLYSDEDKLDEVGGRCEPHFKSDWNPELLTSQNYIGHLLVVERRLVEAVGGLRAGFEGSQDFDLILRCVQRLRPDEIDHVPAVLYHWRKSAGSTARDPAAKDFAHAAGLRALQDHFARSGDDVDVGSGPAPTTYAVTWRPTRLPLVSLVVPTRDNKAVLEPCLRSVLDRTDYPNLEVLVVDNGSVDADTRDYLESLANSARVRVLRYDAPFNYSAINNVAVGHTGGELIGLLNDDIEIVESGWLREMVSHAVRPEIGCVGAKLLYPDGTVQHGGVICGIGGVAGHSHKHYPGSASGYYQRLQLVQNVSAVTGACLLVRRAVYDEVGGLNEEELAVAFNDVDFCLRVRDAGYRNVWTPRARLIHHESRSRGTDDTPKKQARFRREVQYMKQRWGETLRRDPYYNPNLSHRFEDFSIDT